MRQECDTRLSYAEADFELINSENLTPVQPDGTVTVGTSLKFWCTTEHLTDNNTELTCLSSGDWYGTQLDCRGMMRFLNGSGDIMCC